jgi:hypothetical protein
MRKYLNNAPKKHLPRTYFDTYMEVSGGIAGVTRDAASGKYFPANATEWTTFMAAIGLATGNPIDCWGCQDAASPLSNSITGASTLVAAGTPSFQQPVSGYTRLAVTNGTDNSTNRFTGTGSEINTTSQLLLAVMNMPTANPGGTRSFLEMGAVGTRAAIEMLNTGVMRGVSLANAASGTDGKSAVRPLTISVNRTTNAVRATTDQDKMLPTFDTTMAGTLIDVWSVATGNSSPIAGCLYMVRFTGAAAELTDAQLKTLLQGLGWSIAWS